MIGQTLGRYQIVERLGEGGMGVVFRAKDPRLERDVALKVVKQDALHDEDSKRRFRLEARALSQLLHPNIATLFDFDSDRGVDFLVLEFVPGESLARTLANGPLPETRARAIALDVAEGLQSAHEKGIVHRDLKPGNIVITPRGRAKVLDFGLARVMPGAASLTQSAPISGASALVGTVPYMSPEQVRDDPVDARTDLYALGAVLFEMTTGRRPFSSEDVLSLLYQIAHEPAPLLRIVRPGLSVELEAVVARCLEKAPLRRFSDAGALLRALRGESSDDGRGLPTQASSFAGGAPESGPERGIQSLVVLPFENRSGDPTQEFFADGMTDALIADLAQIAALRVISRTSAMRFKGIHPPLSELARDLRVDGVVEGSALRVGDRVRITVQLVDVASDRSLWAKSYERGLTDILALQSEVAHAIADEIRIQVTPDERARMRSKGAVNPAAHVAYLQGSFLWNRFTGESVKEAIRRYEEALAIDPNYAAAYAGLADSYIMLANHHILPPREGYSLGRRAAERGLLLDESLAELHTSLGWIHRLFDWNWPAAERESMRAVQLNPGYAFGRSRYALLLSGMGRHEEAIAEAQRAHELDPLNLLTHTVVGDTLFYARRFDRSVASYRKCLELDPTFGAAHTDLARSLEQVGRADEAIEEFVRGTAGPDGLPRPSSGLAILYARAGRLDDARATLEEVQALAQKQFVSPYGIASYYAVIGDNDRALDWLERAYSERDGTLVWLKVHPRLDGLRGEPRFRDLLARMRLDS
ncbi:MAG: protein kinase [Terriglobales bacterium]|jgi:serine/threonine protein kinase/tetratricopeptide (TPR) repeat protein